MTTPSVDLQIGGAASVGVMSKSGTTKDPKVTGSSPDGPRADSFLGGAQELKIFLKGV